MQCYMMLCTEIESRNVTVSVFHIYPHVNGFHHHVTEYIFTVTICTQLAKDIMITNITLSLIYHNIITEETG